MRPPFSRALSSAATLASGLALAALPAAALAMLVPINHAERIEIRGIAASVVIGNPNIASVTVVDTHTLYVMGRGAGTTNVIVLDKAGRTLFTGDVVVAARGANVSLYRGEKRTQVNCSYGCVEMTDGDKQPNLSMSGSGGAPGMVGIAPTGIHP